MTTASPIEAEADPERRRAEKRRRLLRMRILATGLLAIMATVLALSLYYQPRYPGLAWAVAFTEASVVGGIADWFAVTALFRRPLSLPIPHTALVPRNKDRIGLSLGRFVEHTFLTPENLLARLASARPVARIAEWAARPENAARIAGTFARYLPRLVDAIEADKAEAWLVRLAEERLGRVELAGLLAKLLRVLTAAGRHQPVLDRGLATLGEWLDANREMLKAKVGARSGLTPRFVDAYIVNKFVDGIIDLTREVAADPDHALRGAFESVLHDLADRLETDPGWQATAEQWKSDLLRQLDLPALAGSLWRELRQRLSGGEGLAALASQVETAVQRYAGRILKDPALSARLENRLLRGLQGLAAHFRSQVSELIAEIVRRWDAREVSARLETEVGRDLQYIRINGTLVGGAIGLALHALLVLAGRG